MNATNSAAEDSHATAASGARPRASAAWLSVPAVRCSPIPSPTRASPIRPYGKPLSPSSAVITCGPIVSSPSATAPANTAITLTVMRIARWNSSALSRASRPARWGRIEVWMAWNSWSGARTISITLNTKPVMPTVRAAEPPALAATIRTPAFISVCSASMIPTTDDREPGAVLHAQVGRGLLDLGVGRSLRGGVERGHALGPLEPQAREGERDHGQGGERRDRHAESDRALTRARCRPRRPARTRSARSTRGTPGRRTARSARVRPASRARSSWPSRPGRR